MFRSLSRPKMTSELVEINWKYRFYVFLPILLMGMKGSAFNIRIELFSKWPKKILKIKHKFRHYHCHWQYLCLVEVTTRYGKHSPPEVDRIWFVSTSKWTFYTWTGFHLFSLWRQWVAWPNRSNNNNWGQIYPRARPWQLVWMSPWTPPWWWRFASDASCSSYL